MFFCSVCLDVFTYTQYCCSTFLLVSLKENNFIPGFKNSHRKRFKGEEFSKKLQNTKGTQIESGLSHSENKDVKYFKKYEASFQNINNIYREAKLRIFTTNRFSLKEFPKDAPWTKNIREKLWSHVQMPRPETTWKEIYCYVLFMQTDLRTGL